jgi:succinyl-CoA synthetase beta subunit
VTEATRRIDSAVEDGGATPLVVKAQVMMGGRGKAGLIQLATGATAEERSAAAVTAAETVLENAANYHGGDGVRGLDLPALLVESGVTIAQELYLSITADPPLGRFVVLACAEGGVDIEELASQRPEAIHRITVDPFRGLQDFQARALGFALGLAKPQALAFAGIVKQLYRVFRENDAELAEINPLFVTADGTLVAGDAKLMIDDNSLDRQPDFQLSRDQFDSDAAFEAAAEGIPYVQFDGSISLMCAGAGLTTTVFDLVNLEGGTVANYLEFGGPNYRKARRAMELCLKNESEVILVVTFGTIARADVMAQGVVEAIQDLKPDRPIVTCIRGTNEEEAQRILKDAGLDPLFDTEEAVRRAIAIAGERRGNTGDQS